MKNFGESIIIGALELEACRQLATKPMAMLGIEYANETLVEQIITSTGQRANLIATVCDEMLGHLEKDARILGYSKKIIIPKTRSSVWEWWATKTRYPPYKKDWDNLFFGYALTPFEVNRALQSPKIADALISGWNKLTNDESAVCLDRMIVYSTVEKGIFQLSDVMAILEEYQYEYSMEQLTQSLERLKLAMIIRREENIYHYCVPLGTLQSS